MKDPKPVFRDSGHNTLTHKLMFAGSWCGSSQMRWPATRVGQVDFPPMAEEDSVTSLIKVVIVAIKGTSPISRVDWSSGLS